MSLSSPFALDPFLRVFSKSRGDESSPEDWRYLEADSVFKREMDAAALRLAEEKKRVAQEKLEARRLRAALERREAGLFERAAAGSMLPFAQPQKVLSPIDEWFLKIIPEAKGVESFASRKDLLDSMNAVNESTGGLLTPLLETLRLEKTEFAWTLICQGANLKALDAAQQSVLHYLAKYPDGLRLMVQPGLEPLFLEILNHRSGPFHFQRTPLLEALHCQNLHAALWLLRKGAGVAHLDAVHESCFHYAARLTENRGIMFLKQVFSVAPKEFTDLLLHHVPSASGRTCLLEALRFNNIEVALALIEKGARLDVRDIWGGDLLSYLFRLSDLDSARVLEQVIRLNRTSEIDTAQLEKVSLGHTPVLRALREGRSGLFTRLIISGADIDVSVVGTRQSVRAFYESLGETNSAKSTLKSIIEKGSAEFLRRREELNQQKQAEALGSPMPKAALLLSNKKAEPASHAPEKGSPGLPA